MTTRCTAGTTARPSSAPGRTTGPASERSGAGLDFVWLPTAHRWRHQWNETLRASCKPARLQARHATDLLRRGPIAFLGAVLPTRRSAAGHWLSRLSSHPGPVQDQPQPGRAPRPTWHAWATATYGPQTMERRGGLILGKRSGRSRVILKTAGGHLPSTRGDLGRSAALRRRDPGDRGDGRGSGWPASAQGDRQTQVAQRSGGDPAPLADPATRDRRDSWPAHPP